MHGVLDTEITDRQNVEPSHTEHEEHMNRPLPYPFYCGKFCNDFLVRYLVQVIEPHAAVDDLGGQVFDIPRFLTTQADGAQLFVVAGEDLMWLGNVTEAVDEAPVDGRGGLDAQLLRYDAFNQFPIVVGVRPECRLRVFGDNFGKPHVVRGYMGDASFQLFMPSHRPMVASRYTGSMSIHDDLSVEWAAIDGEGLVRVFPVADFKSGFALTAQLGLAGDRTGYYPEVVLTTEKVTVTIRPENDGLDHKLAHEIDQSLSAKFDA